MQCAHRINLLVGVATPRVREKKIVKLSLKLMPGSVYGCADCAEVHSLTFLGSFVFIPLTLFKQF